MSGPVTGGPVKGSLPGIVMVIRKQHGGSQSRLVSCTDGRLYVLKMHPNPQGPNVLANEALGSILLHGLGLPTARWGTIRIDLRAVKFFSDLAMDTKSFERQFPACGLHFGSEHLGGKGSEVFDFIPPPRLHKVAGSFHALGVTLFDIWAAHQDARQCVFQRIPGNRGYETFFIDNGHLFGGPRWSNFADYPRMVNFMRTPCLQMQHPAIEHWLGLFEARIPGLLHRAIPRIPRDWYVDDIHLLQARLIDRLQSIRSLIECESQRRSQAKCEQ